jgi:hypothetical protein
MRLVKSISSKYMKNRSSKSPHSSSDFFRSNMKQPDRYSNNTAAAGNPVTVKVAYTYVPYVNLPGLQNSVTFISQGQIVY